MFMKFLSGIPAKEGTELKLILPTGQLGCLVEGKDEGSRRFRDPGFSVFSGAEEMDVVAEVLDDVLLEARAVRRQERDTDRARIDRFDALGRDAEPHRFPAGFADGLDPRRLSQKLGKEECVPGAPCVELHTVDLEAVLHLPYRETPEADHSVGLVAVNANPVIENALRFFGLDPGVIRDRPR